MSDHVYICYWTTPENPDNHSVFSLWGDAEKAKRHLDIIIEMCEREGRDLTKNYFSVEQRTINGGDIGDTWYWRPVIGWQKEVIPVWREEDIQDPED